MDNMFLLSGVGFLIGVLIISLGGGGGGIYVGILTAFFQVPPAVAASTSLATIIPTTAIGSISHYRNGNVHVRYGLIMMASAVVGAIVGSYCSDLLPQSYYLKITGILLLVLAVQMIMGYVKKRKNHFAAPENQKGSTVSRPLSARAIVTASIYGLLGGLMSGLVGVSGSLPIVSGLTVLGCSALQVVGTSVFVLVGISISGFAMHLGLGNVNWTLVCYLSAGTIVGAFVGPMILKRIDAKKLEVALPPILIVLTVVMGVIILMK
ncbi:MAG: sulfite exporter TauE/SafE family protein [Acidaminococcus sp.]|jgi:uncharacterized membrane protein YfcA|nr:sulfite exporter TauE/SafE family protein [Acidaminococcus sp.]MCI2100648.1 sulfite exporter TauE/SafE family protein [Acidaminococcus sp.]MCI2114968.1 sulfite exporter TauE/SafE family protein [Acidaminococcus sp.]MCI2117012.1 sulfite exporter TauE/SafE family protein [Acidaminococcus sp.]